MVIHSEPIVMNMPLSFREKTTLIWVKQLCINEICVEI